MKHEYFGDQELQCVQRWIIFIREGSDTHLFKDIEEKNDSGEITIGSNARETPIYATTRYGVNDLLSGGHEVTYNRLPDPKNKPSLKLDTDRPVYKQGWKRSNIYYSKASGCRWYAEIIDDMNK